MDLWGSSNLGGGVSSTATLPDQISNLACTGGTDGSHGTIDISFTEVPATSFDLLKYYILVYKAGGIPQTPFDGVRITLPKGTAGAKLEHQITGLTFDQLYGMRVYPVSVKNQYQTVAEGATATATPVAFTPNDKVYLCSTAYRKLHNLEPVSLTPIKTVDSPGVDPEGIGGAGIQLLHCDAYEDKIYKLDPHLMTPILTVDAPNEAMSGAGGLKNNGYVCGSSPRDELYRLDLESLTPIKTADSPGTWASGIGGTLTRLFHCDRDLKNIYELDSESLTPIKTADSPGETPTGIGGTSFNLLHCDGTSRKLYKLDLQSLTPTLITDPPGGNVSGIGGTK